MEDTWFLSTTEDTRQFDLPVWQRGLRLYGGGRGKFRHQQTKTLWSLLIILLSDIHLLSISAHWSFCCYTFPAFKQTTIYKHLTTSTAYHCNPSVARAGRHWIWTLFERDRYCLLQHRGGVGPASELTGLQSPDYADAWNTGGDRNFWRRNLLDFRPVTMI